MTLTGSGGNSTVDTTGGSIALSGNLAGSSTLSKVGPGVLSLSGTSSNIGGLIVDGGTLQIPGGSLAAGSEYLGYSATGAVAQTGGTHTVSNDLYLGYNSSGFGSYSLSAGSLYVGVNELIGYSGSGSFSQSGGTNSGLSLELGFPGSGSYNLSSNGLIKLDDMLVGDQGPGNFTQSGGTNLLSSGLVIGYFPSASGTYVQSGGSLAAQDEYVGQLGIGTFTQSGGTNSATSALYLGFNAGSSGSYNLTGGGLLATLEYIGYQANGSFSQSGGTNLASNFLYLGTFAGSSGSYSLSGSGLLIANTLVIGQSGSGYFTQTGGTSNGSLVFAQSTGGFGSYTLNGGLLLVSGSGITQGAGTAIFNFGGGTLGASAPWPSSIAMTLSGSGGNATIDTTGGNISLTGVLSGSGGLNKVGTGGLSLAGSNTYTGTTAIQAGNVLLANFNAVQNSTVNVLADNGLQFLPGIGTFNLGGRAGANLLTLSDTAGGAATLSVGGNGTSTTYSGNIGGNGGLVKVGMGILTLSGSNSFSGGTTISSGAIVFGTTSAVSGAGAIIIGPNSALVATPIYDPAAPVSGWLASGKIAGMPTGAILLPDGFSDTESIMFSFPHRLLSLGAFGTATYSGALTTAGATVYLGGGGGTLYFTSNLSRSGNLAVGTRGIPGGSVILTGSNTLGGTLTVDGGTLQLPGGSLAVTSTSSGYEYIGYSGTGTVTQTAGTNSVGTALVLGQSAGSFGTYNLLGGLLLVPNVTQGLGGGTLNITSGSMASPTNSVTVALPVVLPTAGSSATFNTSSSSLTISGQISGAGGLTKTGSATLVLAASNTYTGDTTVAQGTVLLANAGAAQNTSVNVAVNNNGLQFAGNIGSFSVGAIAGSGALALADTGGNAVTVVVGGNNANTTYSGVISGAGTLVVEGTGSLLLTASNTLTGGVTLAGGSLGLANNASTGTRPITFTANSTLFVATANLFLNDGINVAPAVTGTIDTAGYSMTENGPATGLGALSKVGQGPLILSGSNSIQGGVAVDQGTLQLANSAALQNSTVSINTEDGLVFNSGIGNFGVGGLSGSGALPLTDTGNVAINLTAGTNNLSTNFSGAISGSGSLIKAGTGSLDLTGNSSMWTGGLYFDPGIVAFNSDVAFGAPANPILFLGSGTLQLQGAASVMFSVGRLITINSGATAALDAGGGTLTVGGHIVGEGSLAVGGSGTLVLANSNSFKGGLEIDSGIAVISSDAALGSSNGSIGFFGSGTLQASNSMTLSASRGITIRAGAAGTIDTRGFSLTVPGPIGGAGTLSVGGNGTLVVTGSDTAVGGIAIAAGTLQVGAGGTAGAIGGAVLDNGMLIFDRSDLASFSGALSGSGNIEQVGTGTLVFGGSNSFTGNAVVMSGALALGSSTAMQSCMLVLAGGSLNFNGFSASLAGLSGSGSLSAGTAAIIVGSGANSTYLGTLSGSGGLTKVGSGLLALRGTNLFSGGTTLQQGVLAIIGDAALGAVPASPATNITFTGNATLQAGSSFALSASRNIAVNSGAAATLDTHGNTLTLNGLIGGAGSLAVIGGGTLIVANSETFSGGTTINATTVQLETGGTNGWLPGSIVDNGTLIFNRSDSAASLVSALSGSGTLLVAGPGMLTVGGTNSFSGSTIVSGGTLTLGSATALVNSTVAGSGGTLNLNGFSATFARWAVPGPST